MGDYYYIIVHNNILWMGDEWWVFFIVHNNILWMGDERWLLCHCPQQHLMNGWWVVSIISLSTTTSIEWVMSGEYYIIVRNNILWMGDEWWLLYHCPQKHLMNGRWAMIIISLSTATSYEWVMSGEYYIIVHDNIYWMGDEWGLLYHCPQQHLMNGWWVVIIISLSTTTSIEWVMSGDYYIILHNNIYWMGDECWVLYHCPKQHLMNGWWVVSIISLSTTTSYEWVMSGEYYIIVRNNVLLNGRWAVIIISLSTTTSIEWVMSGEYYIIVHNNILLNGWWVVSIISLSTTTS